MANHQEKSLEPGTEGDPAEFLLSNPKYHDCHLTVGIPESGDVENIGVSSTHLIAHSSVFRDMLADSQLADPSGANTHIKDVSPATFRLMMRHVYGGKLPKLTPDEAAELASCADKYNILRLVQKAAKRLKPTSAEDIFPALLCAAYIGCDDLELQVSKIVQEQTDKICQKQQFLQLDENCLLFIVKQSTLNITELQLWNNIIRWGKNQVKIQPSKTLRDCLNKVLQHLRLLSLTSNEIVDVVLPEKVLTPEEFMDFTLAVSKKQTLQSSGLCKIQEKRGFYVHYSEKKGIPNEQGKEMKSYYFSFGAPSYYKLTQYECKSYSTLTIKPTVDVEINTLTLRGSEIKPTNDASFTSYALTCQIIMYKSSNGLLVSTDSRTLQHTAVPNQDVVLQVKNGIHKPLILNKNYIYNWRIQTSPPLPVHRIHYYDSQQTELTLVSCTSFTVTFEDDFHIKQINYSA